MNTDPTSDPTSIEVTTSPVELPKLPTFGMTDGDQIIDGNGNIYEFNAEQSEWIYRGIIEIPDVVTLDQDGLVFPAVYRRLILIQELIERGIDFGLFKLDTPGDLPYYYFFYSPDDLIRFYPETGSRLRIELDRHRLYQKLLRTCCAGPKGLKGLKGQTGRDGVAADAEKFRLPYSVTSGEFEIDTIVATPIDTQISIRLYRQETDLLVEYLLGIGSGSDIVSVNGSGNVNLTDDQKTAAELTFEARGLAEEGDIDAAINKLEQVVALNVNVSITQTIIDSLEADGIWPEEENQLQIIIYDDRIDVDLTGTELNYDRSNERLWGTLAFTRGASDITEWKFKARQRGPKGRIGTDGDPFLQITKQVLDDPEIQSNEAVTSVRKSDLTNTITYLSRAMPSDNCVGDLAISSSTLPIGDILRAKFVSAKTTTKRCKDIGYFEYQASATGIDALEYTPPELELPAWEPTPNCVSASRFSSYKFEWWDLTDPKYPFRIFVPPRPNEQCCLATGSLIHTKHGLIPIEELEIGYEVVCADGMINPISKFFKNGKQRCIKLTFNDGSSIVCTPDHKFPVGGQLIEAQHLQPFDQIHKAPGILGWLKEHKEGSDNDSERGYIIGYLLGDGWISDSSVGIVGAEKDRESFDRAYKILSSEFGQVTIREDKPENEVVLESKWCSNRSIEYFRQKGWHKNLQHPSGPKMEIPLSIYNESYKFYQGFFSALIDSDGCIDANGSINVNFSILEKLPKVCKRLLDYFGISSCLKKHHQANNKFKDVSDSDFVYRIDVHRGSIRKFANLITLANSRKLANLQLFDAKDPELFSKPSLGHDEFNSDEFKSGLIAGAFMFHGGYNKITHRASINTTLPNGLRQELPKELGIPPEGRKYYKNCHNIIGKFIDESMINGLRDYAVGFLRSAIYHRYGLNRRSFVINRNEQSERQFVAKCMDKLGIKYRLTEHNTPFDKKQYRITIDNNHHIYKLFMMTGHRDRIGCLNISLPHISAGLISVKSREEAGVCDTYNLTIPPMHMIVADGSIVKNCQEPFFWCPNVGDNPCGVGHWRCGGLEKLPSGAADAQGLSCDGSTREPILKPPKPMAPECDCDCESPIAFELQNGGLSYGVVNLGPAITQQSYSKGDVSVIDSRVEAYKVNFKASGPIEIVVELEWYPEICGGADVESENCQYREDCEVHSTVIFEDNLSNAEISGGGVSELSGIPGNKTFTVRPLSGDSIDIIMNVRVNDTQSQCCRGYEIRIGAAYIGTDAQSQQFSPTDVIVIE